MENTNYSYKSQCDKIFNWVIQQCESLRKDYQEEFPFLNLDLALIIKEELKFTLDVNLEKLAINNFKD